MWSKPPFPPDCVASGDAVCRYYYKSFAISPTAMRTIVAGLESLLSQAFPEREHDISVRAWTKKGELEIDRPEDLLGFLNWWEKRLERVVIKGVVPDRAAGVLIEFDDFCPGWSIGIALEGFDQGVAHRALKQFQDTVSQTFCWYSFLSPNRGWSATFLVLAAALIARAVWSTMGGGNHAANASLSATEGSVAGEGTRSLVEVFFSIVLPVGGFVIGAAILASFLKLWQLVFPKGVFLWGHELRRERIRNKFRWAILTSVVAPLLIAVVDKYVL